MANMNIYDMTDTWNSGGTTYNAIKMNVTDAASASDSLLIDLQVGGDSKFKVAKTGDVTMTSSVADAAAGPVLTMRRDSASPAASDIIGKWLLQGEDSAGNTEDYAEAYASITDTTSTSEDATWLFRAKVAGTMTTLLTLAPTLATFSGAMTVSGAFTSLGIDDNATGERLQLADTLLTYGTAGADFTFVGAANDRTFELSGGNASGAGANLLLSGGTHATTASDIRLRSGTDNVLFWDDSAATLFLYADAGTLKAQLTATAFSPTTNDGLAIGTTALGWADLHGATGFTWNIANGDWLATHSAGIMTVTTGDLRVTTAGTNAASAVTVGGTQTLTAKTLTNPIVSGTLSVTVSDDSASLGPTIQLTRVSASPAASDALGYFSFFGYDSGANQTLYADMFGRIGDPTNGSEDGALYFRVSVAGTVTNRLVLDDVGATVSGTLTATGGGSLTGTWSNLGTVTTIDINGGTMDGVVIGGASASTGTFTGLTVVSTDAGATVGPNLVLDRFSASPAASDIIGSVVMRGRDSGANNADYATIYGIIRDATNGSEDGGLGVQLLIAGAAVDVAIWDDTALRLWQDTTDAPGAGNNTVGAAIGKTGLAYFSAASQTMQINVTADGQLLLFNSGGTNQGIVTVAGATVGYGTFFGVHWSQLANGSRPKILRGTICDAIDQMSRWPDERNDTLPCFKISDKAGSKQVYGVFAWWDDEDDKTNDAFIGALGTYVIRMEKGAKVSSGDLIESAGNGCGRVQADDLMRSSTVAKVTSKEVIDRYPDGSFTVPCTLHCG